MTFLNKEERESLKAKHRLERDRRVCDRIKAVLLYDKGWSYEKIAEALLLSSTGIKNHILEYESVKKLTPEGEGSIEKLDTKHAQELIDHLDGHTSIR